MSWSISIRLISTAACPKAPHGSANNALPKAPRPRCISTNPDQPPANRAKWWARLTLDQKTLLASKLDMRPDTLAQWEQKLCQKLSQKRKRPPCVGSAKDKADRIRYRQELAAKRTKWRQKYAITTNARAASGAVNGTSVFIPTVPPRLNKIKPAASNPTSTSPPLPASRSSVQRAPTRAATATAKGRGASCRSTASRATSSKLAKRSKHKIDLTKQGIEPNPGPSRHHRSHHRPPHTGIRLWQCNVRSFHQRSSILQEALTLGIHVVLLQETRLAEFTAQQIATNSRHWQFFHQASNRVPGPNDTPDGGVAVAVRKGLPAVRAKGHQSPDGEWLHIAMQGIHTRAGYIQEACGQRTSGGSGVGWPAGFSGYSSRCSVPHST